MLTESRQEAVARMVEMAEAAGANAIVGLKSSTAMKSLRP